MNTPICDFLEEYKKREVKRFHIPGHKGKDCDAKDITEVTGADSLYEASGIIKASEKNASEIFGCATFYSTEGSSLSIRAMLYLVSLYAKTVGKRLLIAAGRNAHKTFVSSAALIDFEIDWILGKSSTYLSCDIKKEDIEEYLNKKNPVAIYLTSPDYLGNTLDISGISEVCKKKGVLLLVDNAHGAYLKFLSEHPIDLGADMCSDSAHKTLPALTGGAYLHISHTAPKIFEETAKTALSLFGSTSPSYLILESLDRVNEYICNGYCDRLQKTVAKIKALKKAIKDLGFEILGDEPMKITIKPKTYGYLGTELLEYLEEKDIMCEFADPDFTVLMPSVSTTDDELSALYEALGKLQKKIPQNKKMPGFTLPKRKMSVREAVFSASEEVLISDALGKTLSAVTVGCPPAVPIAVSGEEINEEIIECFKYYDIKKCFVVKD